MMTGISYPYPVLGNGNDMEGGFDSNVTASFNRDCVEISAEFLLDNDDLSALINAGRARYVLRYECSKTYVRSSNSFSDSQAVVVIPKGRILGSVKVDCFIVVSADVLDYSPASMNSDYGQGRFDVQRGQVLAVGPECRFDPDTDYDPLRNPAASLIQVDPSGVDDSPYRVDFEQDRILVRLPESSWSSYQGIKTRVPKTILFGLVVPVLTQAVRIIQDESASSDHEQLLWHQRLKELVEQHDPQGSGSSEDLAQLMVYSPLERSFAELDEMLHSGGEQ